MRKMFVAAAMLSVAAPAVAQEPVRFQHEGIHYEYVVTQREDGSRLIEGRNLSAQRDFSLIERNGRVTGTVGSSDVTFRIPTVKKASSETQAARN